MGRVAKTEPCPTQPGKDIPHEISGKMLVRAQYLKPEVYNSLEDFLGRLKSFLGMGDPLRHQRSTHSLYSEQSQTEYKLLCPFLSSRVDYEVSHSLWWYTHILFIWVQFESVQECSSSVCGFHFLSRLYLVKNKLLPHSFECPGLFWIKALIGLKFWQETPIVSRWLKGFLFIRPRTRF